MKLYRCAFYDSERRLQITWHETKSQANLELDRLILTKGGKPRAIGRVFPTNVPTEKKALVRWLNRFLIV